MDEEASCQVFELALVFQGGRRVGVEEKTYDGGEVSVVGETTFQVSATEFFGDRGDAEHWVEPVLGFPLWDDVPVCAITRVWGFVSPLAAESIGCVVGDPRTVLDVDDVVSQYGLGPAHVYGPRLFAEEEVA